MFLVPIAMKVTETGETAAETETETGIGTEEIAGGRAAGTAAVRTVVTEVTAAIALEIMIGGTGKSFSLCVDK